MMAVTKIPISVSPLQAWHIVRRARFADVDGWRVPVVYSTVAEETVAARTGLALADISFLTKLSVRSRPLVNALAGQASRGTVAVLEGLDRAWICRLSEDHCLLLSAEPRPDALKTHLPNLQVNLPVHAPERVFDVTSSFAGFALFGPEHAGVLRRLTS